MAKPYRAFQFLSSNDLSVKVTSIIGESYRLHSHVIGRCEPNYHLIITVCLLLNMSADRPLVLQYLFLALLLCQYCRINGTSRLFFLFDTVMTLHLFGWNFFQFLSSNDLSVKVTSIIGESYRLHSHVIGRCEPNYHLIMTRR
jgi:hypothetical protein